MFELRSILVRLNCIQTLRFKIVILCYVRSQPKNDKKNYIIIRNLFAGF